MSSGADAYRMYVFFNRESKTMMINETMGQALESIKDIESWYTARQLNVPDNELGNRLIVLFYKTRNLQTRALIMEFMAQAGIVWSRKLRTMDSRPIASSPTRLASMQDYLGVLAANDSRPADYFVDSA